MGRGGTLEAFGSRAAFAAYGEGAREESWEGLTDFQQGIRTLL